MFLQEDDVRFGMREAFLDCSGSAVWVSFFKGPEAALAPPAFLIDESGGGEHG